jgi:hypothetical protein
VDAEPPIEVLADICGGECVAFHAMLLRQSTLAELDEQTAVNPVTSTSGAPKEVNEMPTERDYTEWAMAFESGEYRAAPIEAPQVAAARLRRGRPPKVHTVIQKVAKPASSPTAGNLR